MEKAELTKTIEARKLHPRTMRVMSNEPLTIPFGAIIEKIEDHDLLIRFHYLGEPYEGDASRIKLALREIT